MWDWVLYAFLTVQFLFSECCGSFCINVRRSIYLGLFNFLFSPTIHWLFFFFMVALTCLYSRIIRLSVAPRKSELEKLCIKIAKYSCHYTICKQVATLCKSHGSYIPFGVFWIKCFLGKFDYFTVALAAAHQTSPCKCLSILFF